MLNWYENINLIEEIFNQIDDFDTFITLSQFIPKTARISNTIRIQTLIANKFVYIISAPTPTQETFRLKYFYLPKSHNRFSVLCFIDESNYIEKKQRYVEMKQLIEKKYPITLSKSLYCDYRYTFLWTTESGDNLSWTYYYNLLFYSTPFNTFDYIRRSLYNELSDLRPGKRIITVFDKLKKNELPMYFLI
jgi:hypothetical protein